MELRYLISPALLVLFLAMTLSAQNMRRADDIQNQSNDEVIKLMTSKDSKKAMVASKEIFARGEQMIPLLLELEGNNKCFYGLESLGDWEMPGLTRTNPSCIPSSAYEVTVETAALYIISAIFNEDIKFSAPPILCDFSREEKTCIEAGNTPKRISKAWQGTKSWYLRLKTEGLDYLKETNRGPLYNSGLAF